MKGVKVVGYLFGVVIAALGVTLALTNPNRDAYEEFATAQLTQYLKDNACTQAPDVFGDVLQEQCGELLDNNQREVREFISRNTERQNFGVLSIYTTDLAIAELGPLLPSYHFETVGIFQQFYIYQATKR
ncbi:DUF4359 domain-containing protein [Oscillatoria sp. FACHB-1407]|uniref:DUF4359 domain-containing protein n=1 Tax=Oscillatoria sp. FACHB-1407 TaxID=2692847 RepID=UPI0016830E8B|nr:DUF4359 domain-containing protein [Oscillatoria sp. FACHB-1407]MBD2462754.1 DUF4359 domain-containing protein [Oscillatoria sp. FACHB-1407]